MLCCKKLFLARTHEVPLLQDWDILLGERLLHDQLQAVLYRQQRTVSGQTNSIYPKVLLRENFGNIYLCSHNALLSKLDTGFILIIAILLFVLCALLWIKKMGITNLISEQNHPLLWNMAIPKSRISPGGVLNSQLSTLNSQLSTHPLKKPLPHPLPSA